MGTPVSGPGPYARRTDRQPVREMPASEYGERQETTDIQRSAPMAADQGSAVSFADVFGSPSSRVTPLDADTTMPETPVTDGAALGPGGGTEALSSLKKSDNDRLRAAMPVYEFLANRPGSSDSARNLLRAAKGML